MTRHENGTWSAHLPFEEALSADHCLWAWTSSSGSPQPVPAADREQNGATLSWRHDLHAEVFGWALSFRGARIGSISIEPALARFAAHLARGPWKQNAAWLRWWHSPVFHFLWESEIKRFSLSAPVDTCAAWLLPASPDSRVVHDESTEEAWATACRELLWGWSPSSSQAGGSHRADRHMEWRHRRRLKRSKGRTDQEAPSSQSYPLCQSGQPGGRGTLSIPSQPIGDSH